ncbi:hypothetical protein E0H93_34255 [Rhizobium leguminosarum bv. viciae]|uniref:hypothetical protein n=1 Tax=Rhizobium leguminosarum TaxID=384 RepID=UPI000DE2BB83|nr:hypothetical protein [Rhizobium leguminosarum]MBY5905151.1 hypothetical protein [Rhizobium leguminosarum]MBY5912280.1 hypothetical protein [Rhizobium leguminosarum]MBY5919445.1 hypothetical protein [Rhizobium leguminosarum]TBY19873.1 hypothetical protein E0H55_35395 [Rhizobium leguminosarum bv. viciae]TBZ61163.1 hypothetical protein E0H64_31260 [Rhizobium leguminosarum bv. viciae]
MTFRALNQKYLEPASQYLMILGIIALCQPWNLFLHRYGMTMTLVGLVAFMVTTKIPREAQPDEGSHS